MCVLVSSKVAAFQLFEILEHHIHPHLSLFSSLYTSPEHNPGAAPATTAAADGVDAAS